MNLFLALLDPNWMLLAQPLGDEVGNCLAPGSARACRANSHRRAPGDPLAYSQLMAAIILIGVLDYAARAAHARWLHARPSAPMRPD